MKARTIMLLLASVLILSLCACADGSVQSLTGAGKEEGSEEEEPVEIPKAIENLSDEDEILLNGELKEREYINRYFGYKLSVPEGGTLIRENDGAAESDEILSFREAYEEGWGGYYFSAEIPGVEGDISVLVTVLDEKEIGLGEKELAEMYIQEIRDINESLGDDDGPEYRTVVLAGEEHPASVSVYEDEDGETFTAILFIPEGDFEYCITLHGTGIQPEDLAKYFEKL